MIQRNIVVVGASAGGIVALKELVKSVPSDFTGSIFVVLHSSPSSPSILPHILSKSGFLPAKHAVDGEKIEGATIYVAPPDHHMLLEKDHVIVRKGPKENRFRPSIDALFRSAAYVYGQRVVGIVLSGYLNDGTSGLWSVKRMGGIAVIQDPSDAEQPDMPENVLEYVDVDYSLPAAEMGALLKQLSYVPHLKKAAIPKKEMELLKMEVAIATKDGAFERGILDMGTLTLLTCPECHGALVQLKEGKIIRFRCHTGHAFTASALLAGISTSVEETLWAAMRGLEETTILLRHIAAHFKENGDKKAAALFTRKAKMTTERARVIHDSVFVQELMSEDLRRTSSTPKKVARIKKATNKKKIVPRKGSGS